MAHDDLDKVAQEILSRALGTGGFEKQAKELLNRALGSIIAERAIGQPAPILDHDAELRALRAAVGSMILALSKIAVSLRSLGTHLAMSEDRDLVLASSSVSQAAAMAQAELEVAVKALESSGNPQHER